MIKVKIIGMFHKRRKVVYTFCHACPRPLKGRTHLQSLENQSLAGGISPLGVGGKRKELSSRK